MAALQLPLRLQLLRLLAVHLFLKLWLTSLVKTQPLPLPTPYRLPQHRITCHLPRHLNQYHLLRRLYRILRRRNP